MAACPGLARACPPISEGRATPRELKAEAIRLQPLTGMSKRECWRAYQGGSRGWTTIQRYLDAEYPKSTPPACFVQWLKLRADIAALGSLAREFEAAK
jgi:hypothetical protein